ncbi:hypothetical protein ASPNIDRAFT_41133 [Aspergillus niger ATCC 1015]|uniref:Uncharacterized protein n=1 Tax=Aspergillus niger (strain ATCC 1015 / CBS 113.46 / FGSC A1144 / LSHB Ac4 / NCTC 3858a / NRRL 328 / USDA 3528.7) TaxID=380704 RepID=G3Y5S5_ASPNA|nr:hypothetical protein ASPNIDRAFT_41133 [Aspergillus niger ATCC 1015]
MATPFFTIHNTDFNGYPRLLQLHNTPIPSDQNPEQLASNQKDILSNQIIPEARFSTDHQQGDQCNPHANSPQATNGYSTGSEKKKKKKKKSMKCHLPRNKWKHMTHIGIRTANSRQHRSSRSEFPMGHAEPVEVGVGRTSLIEKLSKSGRGQSTAAQRGKLKLKQSKQKPSPLDCLSESLLLMDAAWRERKRKKERAMVVPFAPHYCWRAEAEDIVVQLGNPERVKELMQILNQYAVVGSVLVRVLSEAKGGTSKLSSAA